MKMFFSFLMLAASAPQIIARGVFPHIQRNLITSIRGGGTAGGTEVSKKECWSDVDPGVALTVSVAIMSFYASESAFPDYFAEKYTSAKSLSSDGRFWEVNIHYTVIIVIALIVVTTALTVSHHIHYCHNNTHHHHTHHHRHHY